MGDRKIGLCKKDLYHLKGGRKYAYVRKGDNVLIYEADHVGILSSERFKALFQTEEESMMHINGEPIPDSAMFKEASQVTLATENIHLVKEVEALKKMIDELRHQNELIKEANRRRQNAYSSLLTECEGLEEVNKKLQEEVKHAEKGKLTAGNRATFNMLEEHYVNVMNRLNTLESKINHLRVVFYD